MARIKKIVKIDDEIKQVAKDSYILLIKATVYALSRTFIQVILNDIGARVCSVEHRQELFLTEMARDCGDLAVAQKKKTITAAHLGMRACFLHINLLYFDQGGFIRLLVLLSIYRPNNKAARKVQIY